MSARAGRHAGSLWGVVRASSVSVWASLGRWNRVGVVVGSALLLTSAGMTLDSRLIRHASYEEWWMDEQNQRHASQMEDLLRPLYEQQRQQQQQPSARQVRL